MYVVDADAGVVDTDFSAVDVRPSIRRWLNKRESDLPGLSILRCNVCRSEKPSIDGYGCFMFTVSDRAFPVAASRMQNSLTLHVTSALSLQTSKKKRLKPF